MVLYTTLTLILSATAGAGLKGTPNAIYRVWEPNPAPATGTEVQPVHADRPFLQDYSEKVPLAPGVGDAGLLKVRADRNGRILVLADKGLLQIHAGLLRPDRQDRPLADTLIKDMEVHQGQFVYLTDKLVLSNAWAGLLRVEHQVPGAHRLALGGGSDFLVVGDGQAVLFRRNEPRQRWQTGEPVVRQVVSDADRERYLLVTGRGFQILGPRMDGAGLLEMSLNCLAFSNDSRTLLMGTSDGYVRLEPDLSDHSPMETRLPCTNITCIRAIGEKVWFGTPQGAFALQPDGQVDYYASQRWLVDDPVVNIQPGPEQSVLILSQGGLSIIHFQAMTLADKTTHFDKAMRQRHIRYGFNSALALRVPGDLSSGTLIDTDNDGLWTAMYLAGELFRYAVTKSDEALRNCHESFEVMERLLQITGLPGFPARTFERPGYEVADKARWHATADGRWMWKGTTSSDEIVGHFFACTLFAELAPDEAWRKRAVALMDAIMDHIVRNNWYLLDYDGKPTQWGRWHPEYVNQFPRQVGDRRLNSAEIISFLQAAYHFTGKEMYRSKAFELLNDHGYLDNITIPIRELGRVPGVDLTTEWNHSDDELAFLTYWNLYRYAFTPELREQYRRAIREHWEIERPERNPLWNFLYAATGAAEFDLQESIWTLREFPLDTVSWAVQNSHRKDLDFLARDFRAQSTKTVLPPDERPMSKHNGNAFQLDGGDGGREEFAPDIYLLPYWLGRYLGVIR